MYKVNRITQVSTFDANGRQQATFVVNFSVGEHGPFTIQVSPADFTAEALKKRLTDFASQIAAITS